MDLLPQVALKHRYLPVTCVLYISHLGNSGPQHAFSQTNDILRAAKFNVHPMTVPYNDKFSRRISQLESIQQNCPENHALSCSTEHCNTSYAICSYTSYSVKAAYCSDFQRELTVPTVPCNSRQRGANVNIVHFGYLSRSNLVLVMLTSHLNRYKSCPPKHREQKYTE